MEYSNTVTLKDGRACILRNGTASDGQALLDVFNLTHEQTDFLLTYPEEHRYTAQQEADFLHEKTDSADEIELLAELDRKVVGCAGINCIGRKEDEPMFNIYHVSPHETQNPDEFVTEICYPVKKK